MTRSLKLTCYFVVPLLVAAFALQWADAKKPPTDPPTPPPVRYTTLFLGTLPGTDWNTCTDMNDYGEIVGYCSSGSYGQNERRYFLFRPNTDFTGGTMVDLDTLFPVDTSGVEHFARGVVGINNLGQIAGVAARYVSGEYDGQVWFRLTPSETPSEPWQLETTPWLSDPKSMNEDGDIVGGVYSVVLWPAGSPECVDLGTLYGQGELARGNLISGRDADGFVWVAGEVGSQDGTFVFRYRIGGDPQSDVQKSLMPGLADPTMTGAAGMNDLGHIVGDAYVKGRWVWHAILYRPDGGTIKDLKTLGGEDSFAQDINDFGDIVGTSDVQANKITSAFLMTNGRMWDLVELIDTDSSGNVPAGLLKGLTINNARFICGPKYGHDALPAFLLVPYVPE